MGGFKWANCLDSLLTWSSIANKCWLEAVAKFRGQANFLDVLWFWQADETAEPGPTLLSGFHVFDAGINMRCCGMEWLSVQLQTRLKTSQTDGAQIGSEEVNCKFPPNRFNTGYVSPDETFPCLCCFCATIFSPYCCSRVYFWLVTSANGLFCWRRPTCCNYLRIVCVMSEEESQKLQRPSDPQAGLMALCPLPLVLT